MTVTRGRKSTKGVDDAITMARSRGTVMLFCPEHEIVSDFLILNFSHVIFVRVKRSPRMSCSPSEIEAGFRDQLARLRAIPRSAGILCELWTYTKNCSWRFFRIEEADLGEIDLQGTALRRPVNGKNTSAKRVGSEKSGGNRGRTPVGNGKMSDGKLTETGDHLPPGSLPLSGTDCPISPSEGSRPEAGPEAKNGTNSQKSGTK